MKKYPFSQKAFKAMLVTSMALTPVVAVTNIGTSVHTASAATTGNAVKLATTFYDFYKTADGAALAEANRQVNTLTYSAISDTAQQAGTPLTLQAPNEREAFQGFVQGIEKFVYPSTNYTSVANMTVALQKFKVDQTANMNTVFKENADAVSEDFVSFMGDLQDNMDKSIRSNTSALSYDSINSWAIRTTASNPKYNRLNNNLKTIGLSTQGFFQLQENLRGRYVDPKKEARSTMLMSRLNEQKAKIEFDSSNRNFQFEIPMNGVGINVANSLEWKAEAVGLPGHELPAQYKGKVKVSAYLKDGVKVAEGMFDTESTSTATNLSQVVFTPSGTGSMKVDIANTQGVENNLSGVVNALTDLPSEDLKDVTLQLGGTTPTVNLPSSFFQTLADRKINSTLHIVTTQGASQLQTADLNLADIAKKLGIDTRDVTVRVTVTEGIDSNDVLKKNGLTSVSPIVNFIFSALGKDQLVQISPFSHYMKMNISGKQAFDPKRSAVVRLNEDGTISSVPTYFNDQTASLYTLRNGQYAVVENNFTFKDVPKTNRFQSSIEKLANKLVISGYSDGTYRSTQDITRAQLASLVSRAFGLTASKPYDGRFSDIKGKEWFASDIMAAVEAGVIVGKKDGRFATQDKVTRGEAAAMLHRALKYANYDKAKLKELGRNFEDLKDAKTIRSSFAGKDIEALYLLGVMNGQDTGYFDANGKTTRGQMAKMLDGALQVVNFINK